MASHAVACAFGAAILISSAGCSTPFDLPDDIHRSMDQPMPVGIDRVPPSRYRDDAGGDDSSAPRLSADSRPDDFVRYGLYNSPHVEAAYQRWRAVAERLPQVSALPDPRVTAGFFVNEVETRVGPQQARFGVQQTFPWAGKLQDRQEAAGRAAMAAWWRFEAARLSVTERIVTTMYELAYLDAAIAISEENLELLESFEQVVRARYRVGAGSHPELIRVQVELGQVEDRVAQLYSMRPSYVSQLNAVLNRDSATEIASFGRLPAQVVDADTEELALIARRTNPELLALDEQVEQQRVLAEVARKDGLPDVTLGLDYIVTDEAANSAVSESGDDPVMLSLGVTIPIWREKYDAGVREAIARRLVAANDRADQANQLVAGVERTWFEHTDADRRVRLFERTLIPKAEESLRASLAGFRAGGTNFLDLLDAERTLLEFAVAAERARADRGKSLAQLNTLVGAQVPTQIADDGRESEKQP